MLYSKLRQATGVFGSVQERLEAQKVDLSVSIRRDVEREMAAKTLQLEQREHQVRMCATSSVDSACLSIYTCIPGCVLIYDAITQGS